MFIEAKGDGSGGDNWTTGAISRAKLQSNHIFYLRVSNHFVVLGMTFRYECVVVSSEPS